MAVILQPWIFHVLVLALVLLPSCCYPQSNSNQNIETFFPFSILSPPPPPSSPTNLPVPTPRETTVPVTPPPSLPNSQAQPPPDSNSKNDVAKAVAATAASTLVVTALAFLLVRRFVHARREKVGNGNGSSARPSAVVPRSDRVFRDDDGDLKDFIVDENGLDVLYWRNLEAEHFKPKEEQEELEADGGGEKRGPIQEIPLLRGKSSTSHVKVEDPVRQSSNVPPPPPPPLHLSPPPPPPPIPAAPPPPPPTKGPLPSPPPPKGRSLNALSKPEENSSGTGQVIKLKPLHWDKVNMANADHSMVWDKINDGGSFR